jgi:hypothetical protein
MSFPDQQYQLTPPTPSHHIQFNQPTYQFPPTDSAPSYSYPCYSSHAVVPPPPSTQPPTSQQQQFASPWSSHTQYYPAGTATAPHTTPNAPPSTMQPSQSYPTATMPPQYPFNDNNSAKKTRFFVQRVPSYSQRPHTRSQLPPMPINIDNGFPNLTLDLGAPRGIVELTGLFDTCGSLNTGQLLIHTYVASQYPEAVKVSDSLTVRIPSNPSSWKEPCRTLPTMTRRATVS